MPLIVLSLATLFACASLTAWAASGRHIPMVVWTALPTLAVVLALRWVVGDVATGLIATGTVGALGVLWFGGAALGARGILWVQRNAGDPRARHRNAHHRSVGVASTALAFVCLATSLAASAWVGEFTSAMTLPHRASIPASLMGAEMALYAAAAGGLTWFGLALWQRRDLGFQSFADGSLSLMLGASVLYVAQPGIEAVRAHQSEAGQGVLLSQNFDARGIHLPIPGSSAPHVALGGLADPALGSREWHGSGWVAAGSLEHRLIYADAKVPYSEIDTMLRRFVADGGTSVFVVYTPEPDAWPVALPVQLTGQRPEVVIEEGGFGELSFDEQPTPGLDLPDGRSVGIKGRTDWGLAISGLVQLHEESAPPRLYVPGMADVEKVAKR